jgi:hypothetical protein
MIDDVLHGLALYEHAMPEASQAIEVLVPGLQRHNSSLFLSAERERAWHAKYLPEHRDVAMPAIRKSRAV